MTYGLFYSPGECGGDKVAMLPAAWARVTEEGLLTGDRARRRLLAAGLAWLIALAAVAPIIAANLTTLPLFRMVDLAVYRDGGRTILDGGQLYSMRTGGGLLFTYPPAAAVLAVPLALLAWQAAQWLWLGAVYIPLVVVLRYAFAPLLDRSRGYAGAVFAGLFACCAWLVPIRQEIHYGQVDILLVSLCVLDCSTRRPRWPRGALIGLATAIKLVPGVFIVYLLVTGRRKAAAAAALTFAAVSGLAWVISPADSDRYWSGALFDPRRLGPNLPTANQSLRGMILRIFYPAAGPAWVWLATAGIVAIAGFAAARAVQRRGQEIAGIAITGMLAALLSPVAWFHHLCWVVPALGVITGDGRSRRRLLAAVATAGLFAWSVPNWGKELFLAHAVPVLLGRVLEDAFGLAALALIVVMLRIPAPATPDLAPGRAEPGRSGPAAEDLSPAGIRDG
ncbi:MAG TPA: glycosyltransferase 87 family protein [Streptosporangiaceae bacterium]|jgi:alpha-1,2-mannosyltransferase